MRGAGQSAATSAGRLFCLCVPHRAKPASTPIFLESPNLPKIRRLGCFSKCDSSILSFPSVSSRSDYSIWRSWRRLFFLASPTYPVNAGAFKTSPEQLKATKDEKKTKNRNFRPREAREFLGRWDKKSKTVKTQKFPRLGSLLGRTKIPGHKFRTIDRIFGIYVLRMLVAWMTGSVRGHSSYFSLAIIAFGTFEFIVLSSLRKMKLRSLDSLL